MSTAAIVPLRRRPRVHVEDRGYQFADGVYEVCEVRGGRLVDERRHMARLERSLARAAHRACRCRRAALGVVLREVVRRNRVARRHRLSADHPRRGAPRPCVSAARHARRAWSSPRAASTSRAAEKLRGDGIAVITVPDNRWARVDIKIGRAAAQRAGQAGGARAGRPRGLVRRRDGLRHRRLLVQRLDRHPRRHAWSPARPITASCAASPARSLLDVDRGAGARARGARLHGRRGLCGARGLHHLGEPDRAAGGADRRPSGRQRRARA